MRKKMLVLTIFLAAALGRGCLSSPDDPSCQLVCTGNAQPADLSCERGKPDCSYRLNSNILDCIYPSGRAFTCDNRSCWGSRGLYLSRITDYGTCGF
jgi:hypothetical protein